MVRQAVFPLARRRRGRRPIRRREANAVHKVLETRIGAQGVEGWPYEYRWVKVLRISRFQPLHRLILLAQTEIYQGNLGSIANGSSLQIIQYLYCFISSVRYGVGVSEVGYEGDAASG